MSFNICERETSYCLIRSPYRQKKEITFPFTLFGSFLSFLVVRKNNYGPCILSIERDHYKRRTFQSPCS